MALNMSNTNSILGMMGIKKLKSQAISENPSSDLPQLLGFSDLNQKLMLPEKPAAPSKKPSMAEMMRLCLIKKDHLDNTPR